MNAHNVTRLLTYLEGLKASGEEDKWDMTQYLSDRVEHEPLSVREVTNWQCGTAGCLAGSWTIIKVKDGDVSPESLIDLIQDFRRDFRLETPDLNDHVVLGRWSPRGIYATLDEAIEYLRLCLIDGRMDVTID